MRIPKLTAVLTFEPLFEVPDVIPERFTFAGGEPDDLDLDLDTEIEDLVRALDVP